jgi:hypothetical protein
MTFLYQDKDALCLLLRFTSILEVLKKCTTELGSTRQTYTKFQHYAPFSHSHFQHSWLLIVIRRLFIKMFSNQSQRQPATRRKSLGQRLSLRLGFDEQKVAFTLDEAKSYAACELALRLGNKDPSFVCTGDVR